MKINPGRIVGMLAYACILSSALESRATTEYAVTIQTASLNNSSLSANGPFSLDFQLNYGSGSFGNTATINNFSFGGGSPAGTPNPSGTASGSLSSAITLSDNSVNGFNELYQTFNPGTAVSFDVTLSGNPTAVVPDELAIAILDNTGGQIVTTDPNDGLSLAVFEIGNFGLVTSHAYAGIDNTDPTYGVDLGDYTGVTASITPVPEPSAMALGFLAIGLVIIKLFFARKTIVSA
jgi:hypothetical protein